MTIHLCVRENVATSNRIHSPFVNFKVGGGGWGGVGWAGGGEMAKEAGVEQGGERL